MSRRREATRWARGGFTIVEAAMAMAVTGVLLVAMAVCLVATVSAADTGNDSAAAALAAGERLGQLNAEMSVATQITQLGDRDILLTVPDRTGDGVADTIQYTWSGTAGDPMMRSFNGAPAVTFIPGVRVSSVAAVLRAPAVATESAEQVLMSCDVPTGSTIKSATVSSNGSLAVYARPTLPSGCVSWAITRVDVVISQRGAATETLKVAVVPASATLQPTGTEYGSILVPESTLPATAGWAMFNLGYVGGLSPSQGVCVVLSTTDASAQAADVQYVQNGPLQPPNTHFMWMSASAWSPASDAYDLRFVLYGKVTTLVEP